MLIKEAQALDKKNCNTLLMDALAKEMGNTKVAFKILEDGVRAPMDHQFVKCHIIWDVMMKNFRQKARLVAGVHMTTAPAAITYTNVVSRESVCIDLRLAALNDLEVKVDGVENAYITAPVREKIWNVLGDEHGEDAGKKAKIVRALYGLIALVLMSYIYGTIPISSD